MSALKRSARRRKERYYDSYEEEDDLDVSVSRPRRRAAASDVVTPDDMKACSDILVELMDHPEVRLKIGFLRRSNVEFTGSTFQPTC
jgi:hypothetical protein